MTGLIVDGALLIIAIIFMVRHARLGFVKSVLTSIKTFLAIGIAFLLKAPVARLVDSLFMRNIANGWVYNSLMSIRGGEDPTFNLVTLYEDFPLAYNLLSKFGLDQTELESQLGSVEILSDEAITALSENIGGALSSLCSTVIALVALFIVATIALTVIISLLNVVTRLPGIKLLNRVLGALIGLVWAIILASGIGATITLVSGFVPNIVSPDIVNDSIVLNFVSNILDNFNFIPQTSN